MSFAALDDKFHSNPKTAAAGNAGCGVYARALSYCADYLTDGFVPLAWVKEIASPALRRKIAAAGLWVEVEGGETYGYSNSGEFYAVEVPGAGYFVPDYLEFNPTRLSMLAKQNDLSVKRSEAGKKGAAARWKRDGKTGGKSMAKGVANAWQTDAIQPQPLKEVKELPVSRPDVVENSVEVGKGHALRLVAAMREGRHRQSRTREKVVAFAGSLAPSDFELVREQMLERRSSIKCDSAWALTRLANLSQQRREVAQ